MEKIFAAIKFFLVTLEYLIFPPLCPLCREISDERGELCEDCAKKILRLDTEKTPPEVLSGVFHVTKYRGGTRDFLRKLKFDNDMKVLPTIKKILAAVSENPALKNFISQTDFATLVPLHAERFKERGYNQTELIFRDFLAENNLPVENLLIRTKATPRLYKLGREERKEILHDAFAAAGEINLRGKKILLVDDIYTTGSTVSACAEVLKNLGTEKVFVLAFASDSSQSR